jgi:chromosome segregation ATPase
MHAIIRLMLVTAMLAVWAAPAVGEYYRYTDSDGVVRFTDDLARVPPDQRPEVKTYASSPNASDAAATVASSAQPASSSQSEVASWESQTYRQAAELDQVQAELKHTFTSLGEARASLESQAPPAWAPVAQRDDYRRKVEALNARIERYEAQRSEYSRRVDAFNSQFHKTEEAP